MRNDIYSPGPEENSLPDTYHQKARVYLIDKAWPTAVNSAMYMFKMSQDQLLNPQKPVAISTTPNTAPNNTADVYNQNYYNNNPVNPIATNAKVGYITTERS